MFSFASFPGRACFIVYSYKYLESNLIKHCHVISIHSLGQPLIVRSHSKVRRSRGNHKEIPTRASRVSNCNYFPWFNRQHTRRLATDSKTACIQSLGVCHNPTCIQSLGVCRKAACILLHGVWCKNTRNSIPINTLIGVSPDGLSPLEKVCYPRASPRVTLFFSGRQSVGSDSNKGDNCIISLVQLLNKPMVHDRLWKLETVYLLYYWFELVTNLIF